MTLTPDTELRGSEPHIGWVDEAQETEDLPGTLEVGFTQDEFVAEFSGKMKQIFEGLEAWDFTPEDHRADTPKRFLKMLYQMTTREEFNFTTFPNAGGENMITLTKIPFYTMCAHHTAPFFGEVHLAYIPGEKIAGLSKFARAVKYLAKGFWVQEEFTTELVELLEEKLEPKGMAVVVQAEHLCMAMRGVQQPGVVTTTSHMTGYFADQDDTSKAEFLQLVHNAK